MQPSELVKLALLLILSWYMSRRRFLPWFAFAVFSLLVLMLQQDLGTALIYYATTLFLFYASHRQPAADGAGAGGRGRCRGAGICDVCSREKARGHLAQPLDLL